MEVGQSRCWLLVFCVPLRKSEVAGTFCVLCVSRFLEFSKKRAVECGTLCHASQFFAGFEFRRVDSFFDNDPF